MIKLVINVGVNKGQRSVKWGEHRVGVIALYNDKFIGSSKDNKVVYFDSYHMNLGHEFKELDLADYDEANAARLGFQFEGLISSLPRRDPDPYYWTPYECVSKGPNAYTHKPTLAMRKLVCCFMPNRDVKLDHKLIIGQIDQASVKRETRERVKHDWCIKRNGFGGFNISKLDDPDTLIDFRYFLFDITAN